MAKEKLLPVVQILWTDAYSIDSWTDFPEPKAAIKDVLMNTVGFLIAEDKGNVIVSNTYSTDKTVYCCSIVIPKKCIIKRKTLFKNGESLSDNQKTSS